MALYSPYFMRWKMKPVQNKFHLDFFASPQEEFASVVAWAVVEPSRDIESLRGRMGESARQLEGRACRDLEGLFENLLMESFE